ncbi:hypothetical protein EVAR_31700_1 [Eumeta japonica]|uniref:Uncharacterized protein n=1 Tax=Eumeta variegata TaxID=151549 RepID=A0A4C1VVR0_EUMVA|nr:hypothetical protein EVAR_31700_1 [Eumeta japonica]
MNIKENENLKTDDAAQRCCARGRPIIVEWERDARHSAGLSRSAHYAAKQSCQPLSMTSLIHWNIKRVQKINPNLDLKEALRSTFEKLDNGSYDASSIDPDAAQERHLTCAALAWKALGHTDLTALCRLVTTSRYKHDAGDIPTRLVVNNEAANRSESRRYSDSPDDSFYSDLGSFNSHPLDKRTIDAKVVMHVAELDRHPENPSKQTKQKTKKDIEKKIEATPRRSSLGISLIVDHSKGFIVRGRKLFMKYTVVEHHPPRWCCVLDTSCASRLAEFDSAVEALRARSAQLARRDAERAELLERAETAWRDLETGYQRRLQVLQEKEDDLNRQIKDLVEERNGYKKACTSIAEFLKERGSVVEQECQRLNATEKELSDCTCQRHLLTEDATRADNLLGEQHCRCVQQDRDLQFKEEQLRRKATSLRSTLELQRALALEAERAARSELVSLREQGQATTDEVLRIETENSKLQQHCDELKSFIESITSELEALEDKCDLEMKKKVDELRDKSKRLAELKQKVIECRCAAPADACAQAVRTASLAALCGCEPGGDDDLVMKNTLRSDYRVEDTCSCTSLRSKLLTDVLEGLFGGLHEEMPACATTMPCILLKCLEDNHDWDRASVIRTRLTDYFSKLLSGELDIAIENRIERYRAKWVGATCKSDSKNNGEQQDTLLYNVHEVTTLFAPRSFPSNVQGPEKEYFIDNPLPRTVKTSISTASELHAKLSKIKRACELLQRWWSPPSMDIHNSRGVTNTLPTS